MTIKEAKNKLIAWCNAQIGYAEGANNWNKYAPKWAEAGGWNAQNQPWCDIFVDCGFIECFGINYASRLTYQPKGGFSALCSASANFYKNNGAWFSTPAVGDQVFFNVSGGINHTGIVIGVSGGVVTCIEGNSSDAVRKNNYSLGTSYIAGFGRPNWNIFEDGDCEPSPEPSPSLEPEPPKTPTCSVTVTLPVIQYGDCSMWVKVMQTALIGRGFNVGWYGADGEYGQQTKIGLFEFQKKYSAQCGLKDGTPDCICGANTWKTLLEVK